MLDDMAEEAYQIEHWRMNLKVAREGTGEGLEDRVRVVLSEESQKASFRRIVRVRRERREEGAGGHLSSDGQLAERARERGAGRLLSWRCVRLIPSIRSVQVGRELRGGGDEGGDGDCR